MNRRRSIISKHRRLPELYQEVEYIKNNGRAYIISGIVPNTNTRIELDAQFEEHKVWSGYNTNFMFGTRNNNSGNINGRYELITSVSSGDFITYCNFGISTAADRTLSGVTQDFQRHVYKTDSNTGTTYRDAALLCTMNPSSYKETWVDSPFPIHIFCTSYTNAEFYGIMKVYGLKAKKDGVWIGNYVPCYRKSDNVIGMYDLAGGVFYAKKGSGTFIKGPNV